MNALLLNDLISSTRSANSARVASPLSRWLCRSLQMAGVMAGMLFAAASAQTSNLYTKPHTDASGGLSGRVDQEVTHALALEHDHVSCYKAELSEGGKAFRFTGLPTGKYDLVFVTKSGAVYEGLALGDDPKLSPPSQKHLEERVNKADTFFNKAKIVRFGSTNNGETLLVFIERDRDKQILKQSGEVLKANLRRLEVTELEKATDDWQMMTGRHLYREEAELGPGMDFFKHKYIPEIGNVRVIDSNKDLGTISLPSAS